MKNFSEKLKKALKDRGMTQAELCDKIGMSQGGIKRMLDTGSTRVDTLEEICKVLDLPLTYFLEIEVKPVGFWQRLLDDYAQEALEWRKKFYELEEKMAQVNFNWVSKSERGLEYFLN